MRIAIVLLLAGCASGPRATPAATTASGEVTLGAWCARLSDEMCRALARACFGGNRDVQAGCVDSARVSCLAGRPSSLGAGRRPADLDGCIAALRGLSCEGLGAGIGSGALAICQAAAAPTSTP
jgi:hypothetical protein